MPPRTRIVLLRALWPSDSRAVMGLDRVCEASGSISGMRMSVWEDAKSDQMKADLSLERHDYIAVMENPH